MSESNAPYKEPFLYCNCNDDAEVELHLMDKLGELPFAGTCTFCGQAWRVTRVEPKEKKTK